MISKKIMFVGILCMIMLLGAGSGISTAAEPKSSSDKQIQISNLKILPISNRDCEVEVSFLAKYKNFKTGKEPKMWWQIIGKNNYSSLGFRPLKEIKDNQRTIRITAEKLKLAPMASCSGDCKIFFSLENSGIKSNEIETICTCKL